MNWEEGEKAVRNKKGLTWPVPYLQPPSTRPIVAETVCGYLQPVLGLHVGMGPPSGAGTAGAATATYVQTRPTIRTSILTARFMVVSPCVAAPLGAGNLARADYRPCPLQQDSCPVPGLRDQPPDGLAIVSRYKPNPTIINYLSISLKLIHCKRVGFFPQEICVFQNPNRRD